MVTAQLVYKTQHSFIKVKKLIFKSAIELEIQRAQVLKSHITDGKYTYNKSWIFHILRNLDGTLDISILVRFDNSYIVSHIGAAVTQKH